METIRQLVVTADDYGIGPATSRAILELAAEGRVTNTVLLVNSPYAKEAVDAWKQTGMRLEMGWHPNLTLDEPVAPGRAVRSLVGPDGRFWPLGRFLLRAAAGCIRAEDVRVELEAQYERFRALTGRTPTVVNSHQHCQLFGPVGSELLRILSMCKPLPYVRRIREPWSLLARIPGARVKRTMLSWRGRRQTKHQQELNFPGNDWLAGITDPRWVHDERFLVRWLSHIPGQVVELACHPGYYDPTLVGRDCEANDGHLERRVHELSLLRDDSFLNTYRRVGFRLTAPAELVRGTASGHQYAA